MKNFLLLIFLIFVGCTQLSTPSPTVEPTHTPYPDPTPTPVVATHFLLDSAEVQREGWGNSYVVSGYTELKDNDAILSQAEVACSSLKIVQVSNGLVGKACDSSPVLTEQTFSIPTYRHDQYDASIPYLISPRGTDVLRKTGFDIEWVEVENADSYTVTIVSLNGNGDVWQTVSAGSPLLYDGKDLDRSGDYLVVVDANNGYSSEDDRTPRKGFYVLNEDEADRTYAGLAAIEIAQMGEWVEIQYHFQQELFAEAKQLLLSSNDLPAERVMYELGRINAYTGLSFREEMQHAAELSEDGYFVARANYHIGQAYRRERDAKSAASSLEESIEFYLLVDDVEMVEALTEEACDLSQDCQ